MPNYPVSPVASTQSDGLIFPSDLGSYFISLTLSQYVRNNLFDGPNLIPQSTIYMPIPIKLNDVTTIVWEEASLTSIALAGVTAGTNAVADTFFSKGAGNQITNVAKDLVGLGYDIVRFTQGISINPNLVMLFKTQNFKKHTLQWLLAPNSLQDSQNLQKIIVTLKNGALPGTTGDISSLASIANQISNSLGAVLGSSNLSLGLTYPLIVTPNLSMGAQTYQFKPCAIESIAVDFSAGATPSFFTNSQYPTLVSITMQLTEIELWFSGQVSYGN